MSFFLIATVSVDESSLPDSTGTARRRRVCASPGELPQSFSTAGIRCAQSSGVSQLGSQIQHAARLCFTGFADSRRRPGGNSPKCGRYSALTPAPALESRRVSITFRTTVLPWQQALSHSTVRSPGVCFLSPLTKCPVCSGKTLYILRGRIVRCLQMKRVRDVCRAVTQCSATQSP